MNNDHVSSLDEKVKDHECMLTTVDNPFDPFENFDEWLMFDMEKGYNTCGVLDRMSSNITNDLSQKEVDREIERAIDELIKNDFLDLYRKVTRFTAASA
jgi:hypothetical protein